MREVLRRVKDERRGTKRINSVRDLEVYKIAFDTAMETTS